MAYFVMIIFYFSVSSQVLNKTNSNLRSLKIKELETNHNWRIIDLSHNSIVSIDFPDLLRKQIDLETLQLNFNSNFSGGGNQQIFIHKSMKNFQCVMCGFAEIESQHFAGLPGLEKLTLNENRIKQIDEDAFKSNENLKLVDLTKNQLKTVKFSLFVGLTKLDALYLSMNPIELPKKKPFMKSNSLKHLKLNNCTLSIVYSETFADLRNLESLDLNQNQLTQIPVNSFRSNIKLKSLYLESNQLKFFSTSTMESLPQLVELCLDNNDFKNSSEFVNLVKIYVDRNMRTDNCNNNVTYFIENLR